MSKTVRVKVLAAVLGSILIAVLACTFKPDVGTRGCQSNEDCREGCICLADMVCGPKDGTGSCESGCPDDDPCELPNAGGICSEDLCVFQTCDDGWANCNEKVLDGCEVDVRNDRNHCGDCDTACPEGEWCRTGVCTTCDTDEHCGPICRDCAARPTNTRCVRGSCGCQTDSDCAADEYCVDSLCADCLPSCEGKCNGADNGCGERCDGPCPAGLWCAVQECKPCDSDARCGELCLDCRSQGTNKACVGIACGCNTGANCGAGNDDSCDIGTSTCTDCQPDCAGKCGNVDDGCGGVCASLCPAGQYCSAGLCRDCNVDEHCGAGCVDCTSTSVNGTTCSEPDGELACACSSDAQCRPGYWCDLRQSAIGTCAPCRSDEHCGDTCDDCSTNEVGTSCIDGSCGCYVSRDCPLDRSCQGDTCVESEIQPDADGGTEEPDASDGSDDEPDYDYEPDYDDEPDYDYEPDYDDEPDYDYEPDYDDEPDADGEDDD